VARVDAAAHARELGAVVGAAARSRALGLRTQAPEGSAFARTGVA
jgi:hypothetical protein